MFNVPRRSQFLFTTRQTICFRCFDSIVCINCFEENKISAQKMLPQKPLSAKGFKINMPILNVAYISILTGFSLSQSSNKCHIIFCKVSSTGIGLFLIMN